MGGERAQELLVGLRLAAVQNEHRVRQPGDDAAADNVGLPGEALDRALEPDEVADQRLGLLARQLAAGGAKMPQPAEAIKLALPLLRWRLDLERRFGGQFGEAPGEPEMTVVKLGGEARVGGAEFLRRKQELLGLRAWIADRSHAGENETAQGAGACLTARLNALPALQGLIISRHAVQTPSCCHAHKHYARGLPAHPVTPIVGRLGLRIKPAC